METHINNLFHRRPFTKCKVPSVKWFKEWVPHDVVATGGKCFVLKWVNEAALNALNESKERELIESAEPEPTTEVLFLCSYAGCGKTFVDAGALRKHSHIHGQRQHVCHYQNCGKKFPDSSKLKRHYVDHTGERDFVCPYEGCGKAFSLEFNLRSHMKTHSQENYHISLYPECGKNYAHEYTLKNDITSHHDKPHAQDAADAPPRYTLVGKSVKAPTKFPALNCPYKGCRKAYIRPHKLNIHLSREHPGHFPGENTKIAQPCNNSNYYIENKMEEENDQKGLVVNANVQRLNRPMPNLKLPPSKVPQQKYAVTSLSNLSSMVKRPWPVKDEMYGQKEDHEERKMKGMMWEWDGSWRFG